MPDNKLKDNEIIKAYEFCLKNKGCTGCIADKNSKSGEFDCKLNPQDILDLFNRLQAENEEQQSEITILKDSNKNLQELYYTEKEKVKKAKQKVIDIAKALKTAKAEAYKEVEDKITELFLRYAFLHSHVDMARQDYIKAVDGTEIEMQSVWDVFTLQKYGIAHYDEMNRLQTNIELIEKGRLLAELEKDFRLLVKELVGEDK